MPEFTYRSNIEKSLALVKIKPDVFINKERAYVPPGARGVFGGTLIAQSLWAAIKTVPEGFVPSSLHSYFLSGPDDKSPIYYHVHRLRDGNKFISREVKAYQKDVLMFTQSLSFTLADLGNSKPKKQLTLSKSVPKDLKPFDQFLSSEDSFRQVIKDNIASFKPTASAIIHNFLKRFKQGALDYRLTTDFWKSGREAGHPDEHKDADDIHVDMYVKVKEQIQDPMFHYVAEAYYSDSYLLVTTMKFHKRPLYSAFMSVSLDHTLYFHKPIEANDYNLFTVEHEKSGDNRTLLKGNLFNRNGELLTTIIQEGLIVLKDDIVKPKL
ncbi:Acyl-coenzyme A thioesterase 8 [Wickerhamomyces ciferrii]|uniref:Acyl-coenzyme A thioesterase 8 n=1 Tax=Wickerhamomyces ciferrii (strain ATCC 14091 / BCRC 22168 / CBS 111 / JCM 3599 / NBRC 0793 / NRRL Y-1031 F-60-10) TaxID=1206466 RepID=K0KIU8_WICCF|nr:Acyl-coenzyme A thioesterase 8 [Wickerhamomyces ciferrii]CCH45145.1 Acyl-coenzyme A thioesterase 8 [Wickerhamomyces ciferrii]